MKLRVQHENGDIEVIEIINPVSLGYNPPSELWVLSCADGREHFFTVNGYYDGWGQALPGVPESEAQTCVEAIESARRIEAGGLPAELIPTDVEEWIS